MFVALPAGKLRDFGEQTSSNSGSTTEKNKANESNWFFIIHDNFA